MIFGIKGLIRFFIFLSVIYNCNNALSQTIKILTSGEKTSIRGLSVVSDKVIWVSGSNGMVGRSLDGGETWKWLKVKNFEKTDFRDIEAFDASTAIIMGIAEPAYILKTTDAGETWKVVYENKTKGMFLDAMEFYNKKNGIVIGDPIENRFFLARTFDGGNTWQDLPKQDRPVVDSGEACFASSGTNIRALGRNNFCFVSGGLRSRLFINKSGMALPILQGKESTGANSVAVKNKRTLITVGGDFTTPDSTSKNCFITNDRGKTWMATAIAPHGYRSCVEYLWKNSWVSCGLNGVDYSTDEGRTWTWISKEGFHVVRKAKDGKSVFFAGGNGKIGQLLFL